MNNNIIITGASGFVGQNLSCFLEKNKYSIQKISLRKRNWESTFDKASLGIVHLAGKAHDTSNTDSDEEYFKVNCDLTVKLFDLFLNSDIRDFFYFSSVKAVADTVDGVLVEDVHGIPVTPYGKSKLQAEQYLLKQKLPQGKRLFIIRPCMIHGPGNKGNLNLLYKVVKRGIPWPLGSFHNKRSFLSVDNLCFLLQSLIERKSVPSGVYNFADDDPVSTNELISLISETLHKKPRLWTVPIPMIKFIVRIGDVVQLPLNSERLKKLTESYVVSNSKVKIALDIQQLPVCSREGLIKTITSFKI